MPRCDITCIPDFAGASAAKAGSKGGAGAGVWILDADNKPQRVVVTTAKAMAHIRRLPGRSKGRRPRDYRGLAKALVRSTPTHRAEGRVYK